MQRVVASLASLALLGLAAAIWPAVATAQDGKPAPAGVADARLEQIFRGVSPRGVADLKAMQRRQQQLAAKVVPCTVGVAVGPAHGSGVLISPDGYVLTAAHVAQTADQKAEIVLHDGRSVVGKTLGMNRGLDAGLVRITDPPPSEEGWSFVAMGSSEAIRAGQWCLVTGHPGGIRAGRPPVVRVGRILSSNDAVIVSDCPLIGGDSGGPLFDMQGRVIGIHSRIGAALTANMHVPINAYSDDWQLLVDGQIWGPVQRGSPHIGVTGQRTASGPGALLDTVKSGQPGAAAGLEPGDLVLQYGEEKVRDFPHLVKLVSKSLPGQKIKLIVRRDRRLLELDLQIGRKR